MHIPWLVILLQFPLLCMVMLANSLTVLSPHFYMHDLAITLCTSGHCTTVELQHHNPSCSTNTCFLATGKNETLFRQFWAFAKERVCAVHPEPERDLKHRACTRFDVIATDIDPAAGFRDRRSAKAKD